MHRDRPVYVISVAAELVEMHPQTLRLYERKGLIQPRRSAGQTRLYSERDIAMLREIRRLTQELGVNLAGVEEIMRLRGELWDLQERLEQEGRQIEEHLGDRLEALRVPAALPSPQGVQVTAGELQNRPVYVISVAAELVEMHPQTLRLYERKGLIQPRRSAGQTRLYSERDIAMLREIRRLTQELGVNLAGVEEIMRLRGDLEALQMQLEEHIARLQRKLLGAFGRAKSLD